MKASKGIVGILVATLLLPGDVAAQSGRSAAKSFLWKECAEDVLKVYVDPTPLQQIVGPEFSVEVENGKALVLIVVQDCPSYWFDGEEIGPTQEVHQWVALEAPREVHPVPGAELTLRTSTWFALFTGSSNARSRESWSASGTPSVPITNVSLEAFAPEQRGQVTVGRGMSYSWEAQSAEPLARLVAVNHDVYARDSSGEIVYNRIQALINMFSWDSAGTLTVVGGTDPQKSIGPGTYPVLVHTFRPLWAWASLADTPPR